MALYPSSSDNKYTSGSAKWNINGLQRTIKTNYVSHLTTPFHFSLQRGYEL